MAKVVAKKDKVEKHSKSVELIKAVAAKTTEDIRVIASGLGYTTEEIDNAIRFVEKLEVVKA